MHRRKFVKTTGAAGLLIWIAPSGLSLTSSDPITTEEFMRPPPAAYPKVIWFWMNGNVSREGITLDLEAMKKIGISGVFNFDAGENMPKGPVPYLSKEWVELKSHAARESKRLGMEFVQHNCPGWSASGGPWITPELAMQQITWSESFIEGGQQINIDLPLGKHLLNHYRDIAVLAFPSLQGEGTPETLVKEVSTNNGKASIQQLAAGNTDGVTAYPSTATPAYLQIEFKEPYEARFINFYISSIKKQEHADVQKKTSVWLQASNDGKRFENVVEINTGFEPGLTGLSKFITYDIPTTTARFFRLVSNDARTYREIRFSGVARLERFMEKAGFRFMFDGKDIPGIEKPNEQVVPPTSVIDPASILDLSNFLDSSGRLSWKVPPGRWTVLRIGYTATGSMIKAAPDVASGLECDKFSRKAFDFHFDEMMKFLLPALKQAGTSVGLEIDSYEAGMQNWTPAFAAEFRKKRGYDIYRYLPAVTGRIIHNVEHTERFLWDFRRTQADLLTANYYQRFAERCSEKGFRSYIQPYERGPIDEMQAGSTARYILGEFWNGIFSILQNNRSIRRVKKLVSSIAHINGQKIVAAEAFTSEPGSSQWQEYPFALKAVGDHAYTKGINQMMIHCFTHQPHPHARPGLSLGPYGIHFDRTNTWWTKSGPWMTYLARCHHLLQRGVLVADLLYFTGEESHQYTKTERDELLPSPPSGFDYDVVHAEAVIQRVRVNNGRIVLPDGASYRIFILQQPLSITLPLLRKIHQLVRDGMTLVGNAPARLHGLRSDKEEQEFKQLVRDLWFTGPGPVQPLGKGTVMAVTEWNSVQAHLQLLPDFHFSSKSGTAQIRYIHRRDGDRDIYFLTNGKRNDEELVCTFRIHNKEASFLNPETGETIPITICKSVQGRTRIPLQLPPYGSVFILFQSKPAGRSFDRFLLNHEVVLSTDDFPVPNKKDFKNVQNSFTITFSAKPEIDILLKPSIYMANVKVPWTDAYALYPENGGQLYGGGHTCCGMAIGRNGVVVWENAEVPMMVLAVQNSIEGWSHFTLVYDNGTPSVHINGELIGTGQKSTAQVHPSSGAAIPGDSTHFIGDMTEPEIHDHVLSGDDIKRLSTKRIVPIVPDSVATMTAKGDKPFLCIRKNGRYELRGDQGTKRFTIESIRDDLVLRGPWRVQFPRAQGAPASIVLEQLFSLHLHSVEEVKYFSGTAVYQTVFTLPAGFLKPETHLFLDLGRVEVIAEVIINGKNLGILWKRPYSLDITNVVRTGNNKIIVQVTNLWINRLIGDEQKKEENDPVYRDDGLIAELPDWYVSRAVNPSKKISFTAWKPYHAQSPLVESGLIGPVVLHTAILKSI